MQKLFSVCLTDWTHTRTCARLLDGFGAWLFSSYPLWIWWALIPYRIWFPPHKISPVNFYHIWKSLDNSSIYVTYLIWLHFVLISTRLRFLIFGDIFPQRFMLKFSLVIPRYLCFRDRVWQHMGKTKLFFLS